ncbi:hypothetical protein SCAR479_13164 [Seiridium cardinale]|uniref:Uncharacterized protein n=1 Tax=Seiridium cardinale TaxID=138064 RepID=A0ABR2X8L3_9PEZI
MRLDLEEQLPDNITIRTGTEAAPSAPSQRVSIQHLGQRIQYTLFQPRIHNSPPRAMTEPVSGSSLLQARDVHSSHHNYHNHVRSHHTHERLHQRRDDSSGSETIVQVVQTVSVVQLVDASGATVGTTTQTSEPSTTQIAVEATFGIESNPDVTTSITDDVSDVVSSVSPASATSIDTSAPSTDTSSTSIDYSASPIDTTSATSVDISATSSMTSSFPTVESFAQITSTPSSDSSTLFPTFTGVTNSTTGELHPSTFLTRVSQPDASPTVAPTTSLFSNGTVSVSSSTVNLTTSTLPHSSGTILYNDTYTTTLGVSSSYSSTFASLTGTATSTGTEDGGSVTGLGFGGGGSGGTATGDSSSPSSTSTDGSGSGSSSSSSSTSAGTVAGSVLGAVAGVGLILIAALMLLRYKKRQRGLRLSDGNALPGTRGLVLGGGGGGGGDGGPSADPRGMGEMSQRRSIPFAVPAALANLTGYKRNSQRTITSSEGTERGFQKVSGRKLPSVLQHGGDGYSDPTTNPRDTMMTDGSYYRDSVAMFAGPNMPRLAVGSPMRPESGIPVFHAGPARTPVTESGYFASGSLEPPPRDPLGRSHPSMDGSNRSHGSASRFTEEI